MPPLVSTVFPFCNELNIFCWFFFCRCMGRNRRK
jgi:hypothetical protein